MISVMQIPVSLFKEATRMPFGKTLKVQSVSAVPIIFREYGNLLSQIVQQKSPEALISTVNEPKVSPQHCDLPQISPKILWIL